MKIITNVVNSLTKGQLTALKKKMNLNILNYIKQKEKLFFSKNSVLTKFTEFLRIFAKDPFLKKRAVIVKKLYIFNKLRKLKIMSL